LYQALNQPNALPIRVCRCRFASPVPRRTARPCSSPTGDTGSSELCRPPSMLASANDLVLHPISPIRRARSLRPRTHPRGSLRGL